MNCHQCGGTIALTDRFCEECGASLTTNPSLQSSDNGCQKCGAPPSKIDNDRYCIECGFRQVAISNDRIELDFAANFAGASDRGRRHHQNEDAIALKILDPDTYIFVLCDGVSSSQHPELASRAAVTACIEAIAIALNGDRAQPDNAIEIGVQAALQAVSKIPIDPSSSIDPSSTTIVTAIVRDNIATIGWLGDSRAYWLVPEKSLQLTQDDSWMRDAIESGMYTAAEAEASPYAHAIVRWLGADTADDGVPNLTTFAIPSNGYLLLCTDGLWNYAPDPAYLYHTLAQSPAPDPLSIVRHLVSYANQQGGQDNITVGILAIE
ncbi:PP2C family serine/threonine-protein phosphatase [Chamaesiphon minutus]|uniref:Serine/threonine protein phosphatase n=1 Tax=Chamaesiphon minutus (strain ATCC 27169 / PCC 6605) TaxID=1173020 RepID=K9UFG7_CHAP6|nr:PP2C family serine/threonine-protein phosphatase [Chamaesiphon minutus]AFY93842.1 serine/threonine protein phosphatase [Chamaesiphon minutus PCC 6605]